MRSERERFVATDEAARFGLARGFDVYDAPRGGRASARVGFEERRAGEVVDAALAWLETAPARFFVWVHFYDPHGDYRPPRGFRPKPDANVPDPEKVGVVEVVQTAAPP